MVRAFPVLAAYRLWHRKIGVVVVVISRAANNNCAPTWLINGPLGPNQPRRRAIIVPSVLEMPAVPRQRAQGAHVAQDARSGVISDLVSAAGRLHEVCNNAGQNKDRTDY